MNGTPCLRAETGTRERRLVSNSINLSVHAVCLPEARQSNPIQMNIPALAELVLRRADGSLLPASYLLSTLCHEVRSVYSRIELVLSSSFSLSVF